MTNNTRTALLIVDVQKDFCPGGALAVPNGDRVVPALNRHLGDALAHGQRVYASRDWHPADSTHFRSHGGQWPPHCVQQTNGARFHADLRLPPFAIVISKGQRRDEAGYSAFEGTTPEGSTLLDDLRGHQIDELRIGGLATEYCVRATALDALRAGLKVTVLTDAIAGLDVNPGDANRALEEMRKAGASISTTARWEHFAHGADVGIRGIGPSKAAAFEQAALALTTVVTDVTQVRLVSSFRIACDAPNDELLLVDWLNAIVYEMATRRMIFGAFEVTLEGGRLTGIAIGEPIDLVRHEPAVEVKGATHTALSVQQQADGWVAQCVVDV